MKIQERWIGRLAVVLIAIGSFVEIAAGQIPKPGPATKPGGKQGFALRVSSADFPLISLKAQNTPLANIGAELSKKLQVPVHLGASVAKLAVTADFKGLMLEPALNVLAPAVYVDYEIRYSTGLQPRPVGIYLGGYADPAPPLDSVVAQTTHVFMVEGNTEDNPDQVSASAKEKEKALVVSHEADALTVKAQRQPLAVVLSQVAQKLGVPVDIRDPGDDLIDVDFEKLPLEDAVSRLGPNVRLYVRADLQRARRTPFRIVLLASDRPS